jgi:hypothetical protein
MKNHLICLNLFHVFSVPLCLCGESFCLFFYQQCGFVCDKDGAMIKWTGNG